MKNWVVLIVFQLVCYSSIAQDWSCFQPNQKSYYQFSDWQGEAIDLIVQDSSILNGSESTLYFKRKIENPGAESCRDEIFQFFETANHDPYFLDSLLISTDTTFNLDNGYVIYFLPNAQAGQSWSFTTFGNITISCDSIVAENIFGLPDSVKYFHTSGAMLAQQIRLSKRFGFLDFVPFYNFASTATIRPYHLDGVQDSSSQFGFFPPQFFDYLPYHAGDVLKWDFHHDGSASWSPSFHYTYRDSITQVVIYPDSLVYSFDRIQVDSGNHISYIAGLERTFSRSHFGNLLDSPPNNIGISGNNGGLNSFGLYFTSPYYISPDTVQLSDWIERNFRWTNMNLDTPCIVQEIIGGVSDYYSFNTHQGMVKEEYDGHGFDRIYTLIGARINGVVYGNPYLTVGIPQMKTAYIQIYPNPCTDVLNLNSPTNEYDQIDVIDLCGRAIISLQCNKGMNLINVRDLPSGVYTFQLIGVSIFSQKFVKI